jgi:hypothetical protein
VPIFNNVFSLKGAYFSLTLELFFFGKFSNKNWTMENLDLEEYVYGLPTKCLAKQKTDVWNHSSTGS